LCAFLLASEESESEEESSEEDEEEKSVGLLGKRKNKDTPIKVTPNKKVKISEEPASTGGEWVEGMASPGDVGSSEVLMQLFKWLSRVWFYLRWNGLKACVVLK
jgi:hypothetical protein